MCSRLCASVSHSDGSFFLLCGFVCGTLSALVYPIMVGPLSLLCVCFMWSRLHSSVPHSDGPFFLLCYMSVVLESFIERRVARKTVEPLTFPAIKRCAIGCYNITLFL
jgi:hypothetical protein